MSLRRVPRALTEAAVQYLHATYNDYVRAGTALSPGRGRLLTSATALGAYDADAARRQACFLRMVSVVEAYVDTVSSAMFQERAPTGQELVRRLVEAAELRGTTTWEERKKTFDTFHGVRLGQLARWPEVDAGIEVRNAIAHGLGRLTQRQRTAAVAGKMAQIDVRVRDGLIVVTDGSLRRCRDACLAFAGALDEVSLP